LADVINLRVVRKAKARTAAQQQADAQRALHGQSKAAKHKQVLDAARTARQLDGAKRDET
jgi:hypothetical protein